ncbi:hypothetical protein BDR26DRAFT_934929 [Obelidium mucronatum]|nr:hypothetical protein BDR26DRAFT_934929 [Obelidium mucronatum]
MLEKRASLEDLDDLSYEGDTSLNYTSDKESVEKELLQESCVLDSENSKI